MRQALPSAFRRAGVVTQVSFYPRELCQVFRFPFTIPDRPADLQRFLQTRPGQHEISTLPKDRRCAAQGAG